MSDIQRRVAYAARGGFPNLGDSSFITRRMQYYQGQAFAGKQESVVVPYYKQSVGEYASPPFEELKTNYLSDVDGFTSVNFFEARSLSRGTHITCNQKQSDYEELQEYLTSWLRYVRWGDAVNERGFDPLSSNIVTEMAYGGTSLVELVGDEPYPAELDRVTALAQVQLSSIWKYERDYTGKLVYIWQRLQYNPYPLHPERYINYTLFQVDRQPFGYGILHPLSVYKLGPKGQLVPPMFQTSWGMELDSAQALHRRGYPRTMIGLKGISKAEAKELADQLTDPPAGATYVHNLDVTVESDSPTSRGNYQGEINYLNDKKTIGTGSILNKLLGEEKMTYASSETGDRNQDTMVWKLQQRFKITTEFGLLWRIAEEAGYDPMLYEPQLEYNIPEKPEQYTVADVLNAVQQGIISQVEGRVILADFANWPINPEEIPEPFISPQAQMQAQLAQQKMAGDQQDTTKGKAAKEEIEALIEKALVRMARR